MVPTISREINIGPNYFKGDEYWSQLFQGRLILVPTISREIQEDILCNKTQSSSCFFPLKVSSITLHIALQGANPGCVLEDFVRWYSPRDWVEETVEGEDGQVKVEGQSQFY